jgi:hypothetical protein
VVYSCEDFNARDKDIFFLSDSADNRTLPLVGVSTISEIAHFHLCHIPIGQLALEIDSIFATPI